MAAILTAYLRAKAASIFKWGSEDCSTFVVEWLDLATGIEALPVWLGKFHSARTCQRFIRRAGGFEAIATDFFAEHYDIRRTSDQTIGNVVFARHEMTESMGIRAGDFDLIAMRSDHGIYLAKADIIAEWGPVCRK